MTKLRFAMIGAGSISRSHLTALAARDDVEITGIAHLNEAVAREQAARYGIREVFTDYRELIERKDVDAVVIGIPTQFHAEEAAEAALRAGKHVLCEKPLARTRAECEAAAAAGSQGTWLRETLPPVEELGLHLMDDAPDGGTQRS